MIITGKKFLRTSLLVSALAITSLSGGCTEIPFYEEYYQPFRKIVRTEEDSTIKQVREAYAQIDEIKGAIYDKETNWPIIFGSIKENKEDSQKKLNNQSNPSLMNLDELIMCIKVIQTGCDPGVSIEPPGMASPLMKLSTSVPDHQNVRYIPESIEGTQLGKKVFEADRALKGLSFGQDPITHRRVSSMVFGYKTLHEWAREDKNLKVGYFGRIWFKPKEVLLKKEEDVISFDTVTMKVESESRYPAPSRYASHFEKHYDEFSLELPIYRDLIRIAKEVAIARWLVEEGHTLDLEDYRMQPVYTPPKTDTLEGVVRSTYDGSYIRQQILIGGVIYDTRNEYEYSLSLEDVKNLILNARANKTDISWNYEVDNEKYIAVAFPFL